MRQGKVMRGYFSRILFFAAMIVIVACVLGLAGVKGLGIGSTVGNVVAIMIACLYIAAYFIVPKLVKDNQTSETNQVPVQDRALDVPAKIRIVRDSSMAGAAVPYLISLNGQQVCSLKNGETQTVVLTRSHNVLMTNAVGSSKVRYEFDAAEGATGEIHVKGGVFLPKTMKWD